MKRHLVIFTRAPQAGRVKRRLAGEIGVTAAARFYRAILSQQIRRLADDRRWTVWLFVTPDDSLGHPAWRGVRRSRVNRQGYGDLGQRMTLPFRTLPPGPVVLVGSDIKNKGVVKGLLNSGIDAIPIVGLVKNGVEFVRGDFIPDKPKRKKK